MNQNQAAKPAPAGNQNLRKQLLYKWMTLPYGIFIILMGGSAINLTSRFGVKSNLASKEMQMVMLIATNIGYFMGLISGALVDKIPAVKWNFLISGVLSLIGFGGLLWTINDEEFGVFV